MNGKTWMIGLVLATAPAAASAQMIDGVGLLVPQVMVASEYRFDGMSSSDRDEVVQLSLYLWRPDNYYAGVFVSQVDYGFPGAPSWELDAYGGRHFDFGDTRVTGEVMASTFPDHTAPGPSLNFVQTKLKLKRKEGDFSYGGSVGWTPAAAYDAGPAWTAKAEVSYAPRPWLTLDAAYGQVESARSQDRAFWTVGARAKWKSVEMDVRYEDTDLSRAECFWTDWCEPAVIWKLIYTAPVHPSL